MPIWLRRFTFEKIKEFYEKEREETEKQQNILKNKSNKELTRPNIPSPPNNSKPTYIAKVPQK